MAMAQIAGTSKNGEFVDFPVEGLDLTKYILGSNGEKHIYDLYAISNHCGSLNGGHYTAYVKNAVDNKWYDCNDNSVHATSQSNVVDSSAFILFYRLR